VGLQAHWALSSAILGTVLVGKMADSLLAPINEPIERRYRYQIPVFIFLGEPGI
jgi:hypothetical protein